MNASGSGVTGKWQVDRSRVQGTVKPFPIRASSCPSLWSLLVIRHPHHSHRENSQEQKSKLNSSVMNLHTRVGDISPCSKGNSQSYRSKIGLPGWLSGKECACQCRKLRRWGFDPWIRKIPWRSKWEPSPIFLPGKSHGQKSQEGYSPWGLKESDNTEWLNTSGIQVKLLQKMYHYSLSLSMAFKTPCKVLPLNLE